MPNPAWTAGALFFGYYMALGSALPFLNLYYERLGISGLQIGALSALPVLITSSTVLAWGSLADSLRWHRRILRASFLLVAGAMLLLSTAATFGELIPYTIAFALFTSPIVPLLDSFALEVAESDGKSYGQLRVWGSVGWTISTLLVGAVIQRFNIRWLFTCYTALILLTFLVSLFQPRRKQVLKTSVGRGLKDLVLNISFLTFLLSIFLVSLTMGAANSFLSIYFDSLGAGEGIIGLGWAIAALSEMPVLRFSGPILHRIGTGGLLKIAFVAYATRWLLNSFISTPALALLTQAMHGLSFGALLIGSVTYVSERAPEGMNTAAQSVLNMVMFGIGAIGGSLIGGYLYETAGMAALFRALSLFAAAGLVLFLTSQPRPIANTLP